MEEGDAPRLAMVAGRDPAWRSRGEVDLETVGVEAFRGEHRPHGVGNRGGGVGMGRVEAERFARLRADAPLGRDPLRVHAFHHRRTR